MTIQAFDNVPLKRLERRWRHRGSPGTQSRSRHTEHRDCFSEQKGALNSDPARRRVESGPTATSAIGSVSLVKGWALAVSILWTLMSTLACSGDSSQNADGSGGAATTAARESAGASAASGGDAVGAGGSADVGGSAAEAGTLVRDTGTGTSGQTSPACDAYIAHIEAECPGASTDGTRRVCEQGETIYVPAGCGSEWHGFLACSASASLDCETGEPAGCDDEQSGYLACLSSLVSRTGCTRLEALDASCTEGSYAFGCLTTIPEGCNTVSTDPVLVACCPPFPD